MNTTKTCIITLHGIGFEQPPQPGIDDSGYADPLHEHLKQYLGNCLSDDPRRTRTRPGGSDCTLLLGLGSNEHQDIGVAIQGYRFPEMWESCMQQADVAFGVMKS